jgi:hypothetical protein
LIGLPMGLRAEYTVAPSSPPTATARVLFRA